MDFKNLPYRYPHTPESIIITIGDTPKSQMASAQTIGIQQLLNLILASLASINIGAAIRATTVGRRPRNIAATILFSLNSAKNIARINIAKNAGKATPIHVHRAPRTPFT